MNFLMPVLHVFALALICYQTKAIAVLVDWAFFRPRINDQLGRKRAQWNQIANVNAIA
jgi:hypothetical protein